MQITNEMEKIIGELAATKGYICHGLVNYQKGVSAVNEASDPGDPTNFFPQQCTAIMKTLGASLNNLDGGMTDKLVVEATKMTMIIFPVDDTYFCGVGLEPGTDVTDAKEKLANLRAEFQKAI